MALTHTDEQGRARMVDVSGKSPMRRRAVATGRIAMAPETIGLVQANQIQKGDVLATARLAGINGAKATASLIPLCHPLPIDYVIIDFAIAADAITITAEAGCDAKTGIEMEALTAVAVAALTIYDMCKAVDKHMAIGPIHLLEKEKHDLPH
jgi:cyclic pyranopterin monophosphate synthase